MPNPLRLGLPLALLAVVSLAACDSPAVACTLIGCEDAYSVTLAPAGDALTSGRYDVVASAAGRTESCSFTVTVDTDLAVGVSNESDGCRGAFAFTPAAEDGRAQVRVLFPPLEDDVILRVHRDGAELASVRVDPVYVGQYPNGPDCGAGCRQANTAVRVP